MNKRIVKVDLNIDGLRVVRISDATQHDKSTHFIGISFMDNVELAGYTLQVYYLPPFPATIPFVDTFENLQSSMEIPIPDRVLQRNGEVTVEFVLSKDKELLTINQNFSFEVIKTINGTSLTAYPEGHLKETIAQQIEKIKALLAETDNKITEYNNNANEKTIAFNNNFTEKLKAYNENDVSKTNTYNQNATEKLGSYNNNDASKTNAFNENAKNKTTEFDTHVKNTTDRTYSEMDKKATEYANAAGERANLKVKEQEKLSVQEVQNKGAEQAGKVTSEGEKQTDLVGTKGIEEVRKIQDAGSRAVENIRNAKDTSLLEVKEEINSYVNQTSKADINTYVEQTSKPSLDTYINETSKTQINEYVSSKEKEIKGATFTPNISPSGDLSFENDKNLPNPATVNIKGPQGDPGNFIFKVENGHLKYYTVENGKPPEFLLRNKNLIMIIK